MYKTILSFVAASLCSLSIHAQQPATSPTEGTVNSTFVAEHDMKQGMMQMLARFTTYLQADFLDARARNSRGEAYGCFRSNSTMQANEDGVRSNADLSMVTAFLCKYGRGKVTLPAGITWDRLEQMAMQSLVYAYSTHKANRLASCEGGRHWGSTSLRDNQWESNLWAMSVAYSACFQWDRLSADQRQSVEKLLKAECQYELERDIPTGYKGDTKAEENGWDACVLAATLGLFPDDALAPQWFERLRAFAVNAYSHASDAADHTVIDPQHDSTTVAQLYRGRNLYDDYALQNHDYFHTSYQNVVIQELGEAALALKLFQQTLHGRERWATRALMHNNLKVQQQVLNWLALADGELAMPNGNDWSLFLYDQITSYTTNAAFLRDADALMLENLAYKMIQARQTTTPDGSWLLRSDIGARRMGVEAHRVMMSWLMHELMPTSNLQPTRFEQFRERHGEARILESQNIVRGYTKHRFTTFSWAPGIKSYTGYIAANSVDRNKIIVPFKAHNTGNFLGWYTVKGRKTNARPTVSGHYKLAGEAWTMNGGLLTNDDALDHRFVIYSTPGNAVIYLDYVTALDSCVVTREQGALMAISTDEFTRTQRTLYHDGNRRGDMAQTTADGQQTVQIHSPWVNIDNSVGIVGSSDKTMTFGDRANNNSVMTSKLYAAYSDSSRTYGRGDVVDARQVVYYSNITADSTRQMAAALQSLRPLLPEGWNGAIVADPDGTRYLLISNMAGTGSATLRDITTTSGAPVFEAETTVSKSRAQVTFAIAPDHAVSQPITFYIKGSHVRASSQNNTLHLTATRTTTVDVVMPNGTTTRVKLRKGEQKTLAARS